eukprot:SAG31_NODE_3379_length_4344_cov_1.425442_3_plen_122_part_00
MEATFREAGSLGLVFGNYGHNNTVLIKEVQNGYPASRCPRLVPGLKLRRVTAAQGIPTGSVEVRNGRVLLPCTCEPISKLTSRSITMIRVAGGQSDISGGTPNDQAGWATADSDICGDVSQ